LAIAGTVSVRLIGIAGTDGSGKDSLGEMLRDEHGWNFISVTDILIKNRNRGSEDHVTFDQFLAEEQAQSQHLGDEATLSLSGVKAKADISLENNGNNIESFKTQVRKALADYV
jgi:ribose 1,5-bisphosphokinase PhnN